MGKPESLQNNFGIWDFNERHNKQVERTQVRRIDGSYLMIYVYKTQDKPCIILLSSLGKKTGLYIYIAMEKFET